MDLQAKRLALPIFVLFTFAAPAWAGKIACEPRAAGTEAAAPFNPVRHISIDEHARTVNMDVVRARTKDAQTMGKMRGDLLAMEEGPSGEPVYVFNAIPAPGSDDTTLFRLYKAGEWYLVSARVRFVNKMPALRSVGAPTAFDCRRSGLG